MGGGSPFKLPPKNSDLSHLWLIIPNLGNFASRLYTKKKGHKGEWAIRIKLPVWPTDL